MKLLLSRLLSRGWTFRGKAGVKARRVGKNQERTTSQKLQRAVFQGEGSAASHAAKEWRKAWFEKYPLDYDKVVTDSLRASHLRPDRWKQVRMGRSPHRFARRGVGGLRKHGIESPFKMRGSESCFNAHEKNSGEKERLTTQDRERGQSIVCSP